jgi:oxygen-independent coproporphyrinogen III oxidase
MESKVPGVYLSYPFCAQKCTYCNFASGVFPRDLEARYLDALTRESSAHSWQWTPDTVYLGGGTPSNIDPAALAALLARIPGRPWREATLENAPGTVTPEKARAWTAAGIDRVSLGVQSFVDAEIRRTGRKHSAATVVADIEMLRDAGVRAINIDLIAGLSAQTEATWRESLDWIERLAPEHVSVYMLEIDEDSRLGQEMLLGGIRYGALDTPSEDQTATFYEIAVERLAALGIPRYEISNFARPGHESLHNLKYWTVQPYVGFGADAHSFDGGVRWSNPESVEDYLAATAATPEPSSDDERLFLGLRLTRDGVRPTDSEWQTYATPIRRFLDDGLLESHDGALRLTDRGVLLSNEVFQEFLTA